MITFVDKKNNKKGENVLMKVMIKANNKQLHHLFSPPKKSTYHMEYTTLIFLYTSITLLITIFLITKHFTNKHHLPPSPARPIPILGHLHLLKQPLHRTFLTFSQKHGPIFSLKLGFRHVVVISSPSLVQQCFTKNDIALSNRPHVLVDKYIGYDHTTMAGAPYGHNWRGLRRLAAREVLSSTRLNAFSRIREDETRKFLESLSKKNGCEKFELRQKLFELVFGFIMRMLTGKSYNGDSFQEMVREVFENAQTSNPEDFLPFLLWVDYRGLKRKLADLGKRLDEFYQSLLEEHRLEKKDSIIGDFLLMQETEPEFYTDQIIKGFITNMIIAGTDTAIVTIEWAMSLLLKHPSVLQEAKRELDTKVGHNRLLKEQDLSNLHYLHAIVLETFRLFPAGPLLVPRESSMDCKLGGYDVPRSTILLVNAWAIHRDAEVWDDPTSFKPERFEGKEVETHILMPFGMGRRMCPGAGLGQQMVELALGSLIQCFDWEKASSGEIDLEEGVGLTMPKLKPLEVMCRSREVMLDVLRNSGNDKF